MCFVLISEQTAIISLYRIKICLYNREGECLLRGTSWLLDNFLLRSVKYSEEYVTCA